MTDSLDSALSGIKDAVSDAIRTGRSITVTTHIDGDGLAAGGIITKALIRAGAGVRVRTLKEFDPATVMAASPGHDGKDLHIITDVGSGFASSLDRELGEGNWFVLDHHETSANDNDNDNNNDNEADNPRVINSWKYGMNGGSEICAGGMAYLAACAIDENNADLASMAVVGALGDRQDCGEKKSLVGKNAEIAQTAVDGGLLGADLDLLLVGRETRPLTDALAFTSYPFVEGLTWNRDACGALLRSSGIPLKDGGRWRAAADLTEDEKRMLIESIAGFASGRNADEVASELIGHTYTLLWEDRRGHLRDCREFSAVLNSCGRTGKSGVGIAVCMGDRSRMLAEAEGIITKYRTTIREYMNMLRSERWRISESGSCVMVNGEGLVPEAMTGTISSLIAGSPKNAGKIVIMRTDGEEGGTVRFSSTKSFGCGSGVNLNRLMRAGAKKFDGVGGGHDGTAGATIAKDKLDGFLDYLEINVVKVPGQGDGR